MIFLISVMDMIHTNQINHKNHRLEDELLSESRITRIKGFHGWVAEDSHSQYPELSER